MRLDRVCFQLQVEYMVISYDDTDRNARLSLRVSEIFEQLTVEEEEFLKNPSSGYVRRRI